MMMISLGWRMSGLMRRRAELDHDDQTQSRQPHALHPVSYQSTLRLQNSPVAMTFQCPFRMTRGFAGSN